MYRNSIKPLFDRLFALLALIISLPAWILIIPLLAIANNGKIFFKQLRPGKNERVFTILKFKTMNDKRDSSGVLLPDFDRLHTTGKILRKLSLDELPQLLNVIKGDMSFVGPRPLLVDYLKYYSTEQNRRHLVMPGITGWSQVNGRNSISWLQKFELDCWYVDNQSFLVDLKILVLTVFKVLKTSEVNANASETMSPFNGNN
jgi:lipopolysaccharide/colanic/teichoic acid biosynthesis glycosyltransferase